MKKGFKKAIASVLAVTMVLGSSIMSFAGSTPSSNGVSNNGISNNTTLSASGNFEGHVDKSVFNVVLPTVKDGDYSFIIDPEDLIAQTDGARYGESANFVSANNTGVYFATYVDDNDVTQYTNNSISGNVVNMSSVSVNVTMSIKITDLNSAITMVSENGLNADTKPNLWLAITDGSDKETVEDKTASFTTTIAGVNGNYMVSWNATKDQYEYVIDEANASDWETANLYLTGACNKTGDWSASSLVNPSYVEVTWKYAAAGELTVSAAKNSVVITGLSADPMLTAVTIQKPNGDISTLTKGTHYKYNYLTHEFFIIKEGLLETAYQGSVLTLTFDSNETATVKIQ